MCFIKARQCVLINKQGELDGVKIEREAKGETEIVQIIAQSGSNGKEKKEWEAEGRGRKQKQKPDKQMKNK